MSSTSRICIAMSTVPSSRARWPRRQMKQVGFYCSDSQIKSVRFLADSLLAIVVDSNEVRVLSTAKFIPDMIEGLLQDKKRHQTIREVKEAVNISSKSQMQPEYRMSRLTGTQFTLRNEKTKIQTKRVALFN